MTKDALIKLLEGNRYKWATKFGVAIAPTCDVCISKDEKYKPECAPIDIDLVDIEFNICKNFKWSNQILETLWKTVTENNQAIHL